MKCPECGLDLSNLVPDRWEGCPSVRYWQQRTEAATVQLERYRCELQRLQRAAQSNGDVALERTSF